MFNNNKMKELERKVEELDITVREYLVRLLNVERNLEDKEPNYDRRKSAHSEKRKQQAVKSRKRG